MPSPRALALVEDLEAVGLSATASAGTLQGMLPAVLVGPPSYDYTRGTFRGPEVAWTLYAVAATSDTEAAWEEIDDMRRAVAEVFPLTTAVPASVAISDTQTMPAYALTYTEITEE